MASVFGVARRVVDVAPITLSTRTVSAPTGLAVVTVTVDGVGFAVVAVDVAGGFDVCVDGVRDLPPAFCICALAPPSVAGMTCTVVGLGRNDSATAPALTAATATSAAGTRRRRLMRRARSSTS